MTAKHIILIGIITTVILLAGCKHDHEAYPHVEFKSAVGMMQHNVYFYLNEDVTEDERKNFEQGLITLLEIPHIFRSELGVPAPTEDRDVIDNSYAYTIFTWFETLEDHDLYQEHPEHIRFIEDYNHLWANVRVYDADIFFAR